MVTNDVDEPKKPSTGEGPNHSHGLVKNTRSS